MLTLREDLAWVHMNATRQKDGTWMCNTHDVPITEEHRQRSIWSFPMPAGFGSAPRVRHLFCPECSPDRAKSNKELGEPVFDIQLIDADEKYTAIGPEVKKAVERARAQHTN